MPQHEVVIVGAGFSGIGAAILLDKAGFSDYLVVEEGDGVGGAWHWNTYPGIAVDIPSFSYQFSFEPRADWSRVYAPGRELKRYAERCVDKYGIRDRIRFDTRVTHAAFDERDDLWRLETQDGESDPRRASSSTPPARCRSPSTPRSTGWTSSAASRCTRRAGTTPWTCAASGSGSSARAPRRCR